MRTRQTFAAPLLGLALALLLAPPPPALAQGVPPSPHGVAPKDYRTLQRYRREIADGRRTLDRYRARLERLDALLSARILDLRAVGELHARVQDEMAREARARKLQTGLTLSAAARAAAGPKPGARPQPAVAPRFFTAADESRVEEIAKAWADLRDRLGRAEVEQRDRLLSERVSLARFELAANLRAFKELGGDPAYLGVEEDDEEAEDEGPNRSR